ncbi:MAG: hypothetical protein GXP25_08600 [Planctomycetes bacterium]|nr:hypothetical protein [Planctomycetota bacterium]
MAARIKIGWATRDITPQRPVMIRGLFNLRISTRVRDPLTLTALAIDGDGDQAIIASIDACGADDEVIAQARDIVGKRLPAFDRNKLVVSATHTHTGPFAGGTIGLQKEEEYVETIRARYPDYMSVADYTRLLVGSLADAACEAWETRGDASVGWGYSYAVVGENRRIRYFDGRAVMYGKTNEPDFSHVEGHVDHGVNLLFTYGPDGTLMGVLVNLACPSQSNEGGQDYISADFWHDTRNEIRRRFGEKVFILPQCSAAGDISPHRQVAAQAEDRMMRLKYGEGLNRGSNQSLRLDIARRIADAVSDAEPFVRKDLHESLTMRHVCRSLALPHWNVTEKEYNEVQEQIAQHEAALATLPSDDPLSARVTSTRSRINWCRRVVERYENPPESIPVEMNVIRLGDIAFVTSPFEYYLDFGDRIKGRSPAVQTFVVQLAGGGTYLPTERAAAGCSYGAVPASCRVSPQGGQVIVDEAIKVLGEMYAS